MFVYVLLKPLKFFKLKIGFNQHDKDVLPPHSRLLQLTFPIFSVAEYNQTPIKLSDENCVQKLLNSPKPKKIF